MSWRDHAERVARGKTAGDDEDERDKTPPEPSFVPIVPFVPASPALNPLSELRAWRIAIERLNPCQPLTGFSMHRWQVLCDCAIWFLDGFGEHAARHGWSEGDLFGILPGQPHCGGLIDRMGQSRSLLMTGAMARWRSWGQAQSCHAGSSRTLPPFWSCGHG